MIVFTGVTVFVHLTIIIVGKSYDGIRAAITYFKQKNHSNSLKDISP